MMGLSPKVSKRALGFLAPAFIGLWMSGCGIGGPAYAPPPTDVAATIEVSGFEFVPQEVHIKTGDTVEWRNTSIIRHTVNDEPQHDPTLTSLPPGAIPFDSGSIAAGQVFRHTFTVPGTYRYKCEPHEDFGMVGVVIVEDRT